LRLEDLDPQRCRPEWAIAMVHDLEWLGIDWDSRQLQSEAGNAHEAAIERLAQQGALYPCRCSRSEIRAEGRRAPDGGWRYSNRCRERPLPAVGAGGWRDCGEVLRARLPDQPLAIVDESGEPLSPYPAREFGDPVVLRRDGALSYHLASVVDDYSVGVTRVIRGRDLAPSTGVQVALQRLLEAPTPSYRHHLLLLEERGEKLAKFHGAVAIAELRRRYDAPKLCGWLAAAAGLLDAPAPITPAELLADFSWEAVSKRDRVVRWTGDTLQLIADF
jgi:glutamyl/glutaminyl-tRNA synthetase